jgi:hypothetical protein
MRRPITPQMGTMYTRLLVGSMEILWLGFAGTMVFDGGSALMDIIDSLAEEDAVDEDMDMALRVSVEELDKESDSKENARAGVDVSVGEVQRVSVGVYGGNVVGLVVAPAGG